MRRTRSFSRLRVALPLALAGLLVAGTSSSSDQQEELPVVSTRTEERCGPAAEAANVATDSANCEVEASADAATRVVSAETRLVSPYNGYAAWDTTAVSGSNVVATYELSEPTPRLDFVIKMRVHRASATLKGSPLNYLGDGTYGTIAKGLEERVLPIAMRRSVHITAGAHALYADCLDCGGGGTSLIVLSNDEPRTTVTTSGEEVVIPLKVSRAGDKDLPPGEITVRAGVRVPVWHGSWGEAAGSVDATVTGVFLKE